MALKDKKVLGCPIKEGEFLTKTKRLSRKKIKCEGCDAPQYWGHCPFIEILKQLGFKIYRLTWKKHSKIIIKEGPLNSEDVKEILSAMIR